MTTTAVDDIFSPEVIINNVTGGSTRSILGNDTQVDPLHEVIVITDNGGVTGLTVDVVKKALKIPVNTPVGVYTAKYKIVNTSTSIESNEANVQFRVVSRQSNPNFNYPANDLDILKFEKTTTGGDRVFVDPTTNTNDPMVYQTAILNGYTGTKSDEIMVAANKLRSMFDRAADIVESNITNGVPGTTVSGARLVAGGVEVTLSV